MKNILKQKFDANQRRLLQYGVILILVLYLAFYFFAQKGNITANKQVYLEGSTLHVFNDTYTFKGYPDKIAVHYPYFIFVQADKPLTIVYDIEKQEKITEINDILLDYYDGNTVYNRKESFFNDKNLGEYCDAAFIKNTNEVLCITKKSKDFVDNMLIDINPDTPNLWKRIYQSDNILTTVSVINNKLYIGEVNFESKQNYLTVNEKITPVDTPVNMIYQMNGSPYFASFRNAESEKNSYYQIDGDTINLVDSDSIYFNQ